MIPPPQPASYRMSFLNAWCFEQGRRFGPSCIAVNPQWCYLLPIKPLEISLKSVLISLLLPCLACVSGKKDLLPHEPDIPQKFLCEFSVEEVNIKGTCPSTAAGLEEGPVVRPVNCMFWNSSVNPVSSSFSDNLGDAKWHCYVTTFLRTMMDQ